MALGALFACIFAKMTAAVPDNQGISAVVCSQLGRRWGRLAANCLTAAVAFGPVAVALTAAGFIGTFIPPLGVWGQAAVSAIVLLLCAFIVLSDIAFLGRFMLALSSLTAGLLLIGSLATLFSSPAPILPGGLPPLRGLGETLLLLYWAIVGWEVLGNFTEDVDDPARTMMRAMKISLLVIALVYLATAIALQAAGICSMSGLLAPLFGRYAAPVYSLLGTGLCVLTVVTFTGAVARQTAARLHASRMLPLFSKNRSFVFLLLALNLFVLLCSALGWLTLQNIVAMSNVLFIGNAALGLAAGFRLLCSAWLRAGIVLLLLLMLAILAFSPVYAIIVFLAVASASLLHRRARPV